MTVAAVFGGISMFLIMMIGMLSEYIGTKGFVVLFVLAAFGPALVVNSLFASHLPVGLQDESSS